MTIQERFHVFHTDNPHVYQELVSLARKLKQRGYRKYSIDALFQVIRWSYAMRTDTTEPFKLNDHFRSRYARLIAATEDDLRTFFRSRILRTA